MHKSCSLPLLDTKMMEETMPTTAERLLIQYQVELNIPVVSFAKSSPDLPPISLAEGPRDDYLKIGVPLYEASINCDWKSAKAIFDKYPKKELERCSITENGETALHVAASVKRSSKQVEKFVKNLVRMMEPKDLELENKDFNTSLYLAASAGNIQAVRIMTETNKKLLTIAGRKGTMMPLYAAALFGNHEVVKYLYENSKDLRDDDWNPQNRGWLLERCVEGDMFDVALKIVNIYPQLGRSVLEILARKPEVLYVTKPNIIVRGINSVLTLIGLREVAYEKESEALQLLKFIWEDIVKRPKEEIDVILRGQLDSQNLICQLLGQLHVETETIIRQDVTEKSQHLRVVISKHLVNILTETENLVIQDLDPCSRKRARTLEFQKLIKGHIANINDEFNQITTYAHSSEVQSYLQKLISKHITQMYALLGLESKQYSSRILLIAAETGNTKFLVELIRRYPDLIWKVNDDNQTIFHVAVKYRHAGVYNLLYEIGSRKDIVTLRDSHDNNMLHLAGKQATKERLADVSGPALQMQRELLWFKEVSNVIPPYYRELKNKDGLTPHELFVEEHKELIREGEKWMKEAASQCMVVAALIATIVFAAAFTIPGGYNQNDGIPIFYKKTIFVVFVVADAMSLFFSSASILTFLSILTSRYAERDFVESLPKKLMLGISSLFLSITAMMITFSVSFFILYHKEMSWIPIFVSVFALVPVLLYVVLQYHVLIDVIRSTYGSKYLFKTQKQFLYYVNPKD